MKTIAMVNNKGGVAKTSTAANLGAFFANQGNKVLLLDIDPQANLTQHFNFYEPGHSVFNSFTDFKEKGADAKLPLLEVTENLYLVPASPELKEMEKLLVTYNGRERVLRKLLKPFEDLFDFCIIDCPPSLGTLTDNAIASCTGVIIPIEASVFSLNGVKTIMKYLSTIKDDLELDFDIVGVFMAKFDKRTSIATMVKNEVQKYFGENMFDTVVRINIAVSEAQANGVDVFSYDKRCNAAIDYARLGNEILKRMAN